MVYRKRQLPHLVWRPANTPLALSFLHQMRSGLIAFLQVRKQIQPEYIRDNPVFDIQVNPDHRNKINFQAFRLSPKRSICMDLAMRNFFIFLPNIGATVSANKMDINFWSIF